MSFDTGLSDHHHIVCFSTKLNLRPNNPRQITYRSYKKSIEIKYECELQCAPFHVAEIIDDVDDTYWYHETLLSHNYTRKCSFEKQNN